MRWLSIVLSLFGTKVTAQPLDLNQRALYLAFAEDVSGADPVVMAQAFQFVAAPPITLETIGFYGLNDATGAERALRGIVTVLVDKGYILDLEIKYLIPDFEPSLREAGAIGETTNAPDLMAAIPEGDWDDPAFQVEAMTALAATVGPFAHAIEAEVADRDRAILQLSMPLGDAVFYWVTTPEIAQRWRCVSLWAGADVTRVGRTIDIMLAGPDWVQFYDLIRIEPVGGGMVPDVVLDVPNNACAVPQV